VTVTTEAGCPWTVSSVADWLSASSGSGAGPTQLQVAAAPNLTFAPARHDGRPVAASFLQPIYFRHPGVGGTTP